MGWTKEHRECLQQAADNGDEAAAAELERMRARNLENKRRSDARLRAQRKNQTSVSKAIDQRLRGPKDDIPATRPPPPARSSTPPPQYSTTPLRGCTEIRDLVRSKVETASRERVAQDMYSKRLGAFEGFEGVRWKPLGEIRGEQEAQIELKKARVLEDAVKERKKALKKMVKEK